MSFFSKREKTEEDVELVDLEDLTKPQKEKESEVPEHADEFLGLKQKKKDPLAPLRGVGEKIGKAKILHFLSRFLPGLEEVTGAKTSQEDAKLREKLEQEAENIREKTTVEPLEPGENAELEALLEPLVEQEVEDLLREEHEQEILFVQWERDRYRNDFLGWTIAAFSAILFVLLATVQAGNFINHLLDPNLLLPGWIEKPFGHDVAQGTIFVAGMLNVVAAFIVFVIAVTSVVTGLLSQVWRGIIMGLVGFMGLFLWLGFMSQNKYFTALITLAVLFIIYRVMERVRN